MGWGMKKFVCSTILIFAVVLMVAACGSANKKGGSDAVSKSEEAKESESGEPNEGNNESDWITEWIKSNSTDEEICAVGESRAPARNRFEGMQEAQQRAQMQLCRQIAADDSFSCDLPPVKMKGQRQSQRVDPSGHISVYVLACIERKDLEEENKKESEKETSETDNTDSTNKTDEDKVVQ